ncbi:flagellar motor switch protein FliM [Deltaproteobacteria bacterium TL4]
MSQILSKKEVELLLKGIPEIESEPKQESPSHELADEIVPFDLAHQNRVIRGRMPGLEMVHSRLARLFRQTISMSLRRPVHIQCRATELMNYKDYIEGIAYPASVNLFHLSPLRGNALLVLEQRLVYTFIDMLFGGTGELEVHGVSRDFSNIEMRMISKVVHSALDDLQAAWEPLVPLRIRYVRSETNPRLLTIVPDSEVVVVTTFDAEIHHSTMTFSICIPYSLLDPIRSKLNAGLQSEHSGRSATISNYLSENVKKTTVNVKVYLGHHQISLRRFLQLDVGDHIPLDQECSEPLKVLIQNVAKLEGFQGAYKGQRAIKISKLLYEPRAYSNLFDSPTEED